MYSDSEVDDLDSINTNTKPVDPRIRNCYVRLERLESDFRPKLPIAGFKWIGPVIKTSGGKDYFRQVETDEILTVGDFVYLQVCLKIKSGRTEAWVHGTQLQTCAWS